MSGRSARRGGLLVWARRRRHRRGSSLVEAYRSRRTRVEEWWLRSRGWRARKVCRKWACACAGGRIRGEADRIQCRYHMIRTMAARGSEAGSSAKTERLGMRVRPAVRPASGRTCWEVVSRGREGVVCITHLPEQRCEGHWGVNVCEDAAAATARAILLSSSRLSGCSTTSRLAARDAAACISAGWSEHPSAVTCLKSPRCSDIVLLPAWIYQEC